jgi:hypothetical protein
MKAVVLFEDYEWRHPKTKVSGSKKHDKPKVQVNPEYLWGQGRKARARLEWHQDVQSII